MTQRILIIDDDVILSGLLQLTLEVEGFDVETAGDGDEGLTMVKSRHFDLILLDLVMPQMDGIKFLRLLNESGVDRPPIMIVSSATGTEITDQHQALGVVDIARKPVEPAELIVRAKKALIAGGAG